MNRTAAHVELRSLLTEAQTVMGPSRIALGATCSLSAIEDWTRRPHVQITGRTANQVLPRLRSWRDWVPGYQIEQEEIRQLEATAMACWENRLEELKNRLDQAAFQYSLKTLALGCETSGHHLLLWRLGYCMDLHLHDLARALGHLRYIDAWPVTADRPTGRLGQTPAAAGMTRYDLV